MKTHLVNIDYEYSLFDPKYNSEKLKYSAMNSEWEFMLWYCEPEKMLYSERKYKHTYLAKIQSLTGKQPQYTNKADNLVPWFGPTKNMELMKKLNSRIYCCRWAKENNYLPDDTKVYDLFPHRLPSGYIAKEAGGFSGKGIHTKLNKKMGPVIIEPLLNRKNDYSCLFIKGEPIYYKNEVDNHFQYKGSSKDNINDWSLESLKLGDKFNNVLRDVTNKVYVHYNSQCEQDVWGFDFFTYEEGDELLLYPINEVNFRKTLGYLFYKVCLYFSHKQSANLIITKYKREDAIQLSPDDNKFNTYLEVF